jgi:pimeloyl-ACP methyl ester carboxylesterase
MKVYFVSGLAADSRVFKYIQLPPHCETVYLEWIKPLPNESLENYAIRLSENINTQEPFALIGLSMGGMMVSEISKRLKPVITILISSVPTSNELPFYFKIAGKWHLQKAVPISLVKSAALIKRFFTAETEEDKTTIRQIIRESDDQFIRWAMGAILKWENKMPPTPYIHIHGTRDEVLPIKFTKPTHIIPKAGHLMVMTHKEELNRILENALSKDVYALK